MEPIQRHNHQVPLELSSLISQPQSEVGLSIANATVNNDINELSERTASEANQRMKELLASGMESLLADRQEEATQILQKVQRLIDYLSKLDPSLDLALKVVCYYNLACIYQQQWLLDRCCHYLLKAVEAMELLCHQENRTSIKRSTLLVQGTLQYCAVLSQSGEQIQMFKCSHEQALEAAKKSLPLLKQIFNYSYELCAKALRESENGTSEQKKKVVFGGQVLRTALEYLQNLHDIPTYAQMNEQDTQALEATRQRIYFWKNNPENNEKLMRIELGVGQCEQVPQQRNLLGLQSNDSWMATHNIGTIMHIKPLHYQEYAQEDVFMFQMSKRKILERAMLASVGYFSLSTELRFIELEKAKRDRRNNTLLDKYALNEQSKTSEIFHLKAVQIICTFIKQNSVYVNHLIASYHKHYKQNLLVITEEPSMIEYSFIQKPEVIDISKEEKEKLEGSTSNTVRTNQQPSKSKKLVGYQSFKKREAQKQGTSNSTLQLKLKNSLEQNSNDHYTREVRVKLSSKSKERSIPSITYEDTSRMTKPSENSRREHSGRSKPHTHRSSKRLEMFTKDELFDPKCKSKSQSKLSNKSRDRMKKSLKVSSKAEKNILIEGDYPDEPSSDPFEKITSRNMDFLSKQLKSPQAATISLTKKAFKKPVERYADFTQTPTSSSNQLFLSK